MVPRNHYVPSNRDVFLLKKEIRESGVGWDVEHIDSATTNSLDQLKSQREWVLSAYLSLTKDHQNELQKDKNLKTFFYIKIG